MSEEKTLLTEDLIKELQTMDTVSYTHLTLPTTEAV